MLLDQPVHADTLQLSGKHQNLIRLQRMVLVDDLEDALQSALELRVGTDPDSPSEEGEHLGCKLVVEDLLESLPPVSDSDTGHLVADPATGDEMSGGGAKQSLGDRFH